MRTALHLISQPPIYFKNFSSLRSGTALCFSTEKLKSVPPVARAKPERSPSEARLKPERTPLEPRVPPSRQVPVYTTPWL